MLKIQKRPRIHALNIPLNAQVPDHAALGRARHADAQGGKGSAAEPELGSAFAFKHAVGIRRVGPDIAFQTDTGPVNAEGFGQIVLQRAQVHASDALIKRVRHGGHEMICRV